MSEEKEKSLYLKEIVINAEECRGALDFWHNFKIPFPQPLIDAFQAFEKEPTIENQNALKYELCKTIATTDHSAFTDDIFSDVVDQCKRVAYNMSFDKEFEANMTVEENESNKEEK